MILRSLQMSEGRGVNTGGCTGNPRVSQYTMVDDDLTDQVSTVR